MSTLLERRSRQTRQELVRVAMELFGRDGFDETSMEDVARAAGVSRRTAYRYFATKEDLVFEPVKQWFAILQRAVAARGADESTRDLCRRAHMEIAAFIQADPVPVLDAWAIVAGSQALLDRQGKSNAEWVEFYAELILSDTGGGPEAVLAATATGAALIAVTAALFPVWSSAPDELDLLDMTRSVLDQIDSVWPPATR